MQKKKLFVLGDSISIHYGPYLQAMAEEQFDYDRKGGSGPVDEDMDYPQRANGGDSWMVLDYINQRNQDNLWEAGTYLILNCGLHDIKHSPSEQRIQVSKGQYIENLENIIAIAKQADLIPLWIRTTPVVDQLHNRRTQQFYRYQQDVVEYNADADQVMLKENVPIIDLHTFTNHPGGNERFVDHVHYSDEIRRLQAAFIYGALSSLVTNSQA